MPGAWEVPGWKMRRWVGDAGCIQPSGRGGCDPLGAWPLLLLGAGVAPWLPRPGAVLSRVALALSVCPPHAEGRALVLQQGLHMWGHVASAKEHFSL